MSVRLFNQDSLTLDLPTTKAAIISDPPYGCRNDCNYQRFTGSKAPNNSFPQIHGDASPFDPTPWLRWPIVVLFGYQYFAQHLPVGTVLVWNKKRDNQLGTFLSDCELAWLNKGKGVYLFNHVWNGFDRASEKGKTLHPTQKPIQLMEWVITKAKIPKDYTIIDPYMGSGATGLAAVNLGYSFVGCEIVA